MGLVTPPLFKDPQFNSPEPDLPLYPKNLTAVAVQCPEVAFPEHLGSSDPCQAHSDCTCEVFEEDCFCEGALFYGFSKTTFSLFPPRSVCTRTAVAQSLKNEASAEVPQTCIAFKVQQGLTVWSIKVYEKMNILFS